MVNLEAELNGFHALFGIRLKSETPDLLSILAEDDELRESLAHVDDLGDKVMYVFQIGACEAVFTESKNQSFLTDSDLNITSDDRLTYRMMGYKLIFFTISSRDKDENYKLRDRVLKNFSQTISIDTKSEFKDIQEDLLHEVCQRRYMEDIIDAETIEITSNRYNILWHYFVRKRLPVLQNVIQRNNELRNALVVLQQEGDMLYAAFEFKHDGQSVKVTLSEKITVYAEGRLFTKEGETLDGKEYNTLSVTVWSKDRKLNAEYTQKLKSYFSEFDVKDTKAPRHFIKHVFEYLEDTVMTLNDEDEK